MATTSNIKNGSVIFHKNKRMKVLEFLHVKPGKGPAFVRTKLKDISTGKVIDETFNSGVKLEFLKIEAKEMQYLYSDTDTHFFMDNQTFEQVSVLDSIIGKNLNFLKDGMNVDLLFDGSEILISDYLHTLILKLLKQSRALKVILQQEQQNLQKSKLDIWFKSHFL